MTRKTDRFNRFSVLFISALAYYIAGLVGLELAIPPGFASAVWPASGVALALMIMFPSIWVIVGTFVASFLLNIKLISGEWVSFDVSISVIPLCIASGAALQLWVGYWLYNRVIDKKITVDVGDTIIRFSLLVVPFSSLISASVGTLTLLRFEVIQQEEYLFSWMTWWLGDSIGILLFTPMLVVMFDDNSQFQFSRKLQIVVPSVLIFSCTCLLFFWSTESRHDNIAREFEDKANGYTQKIKERLKLSKSKLESYQAFFQASNYISFKEFESYSKTLLADDGVLHGVGWTEVTAHADRAKVERDIRKQGYKDFEFKQPKNKTMVRVEDKNEYYPVLYIYPYKNNKQALGLDLSTLPGRLELLKKIQVTGKGRVTSPITLVQEKENEKAIIVYLPVWKKYPHDEVLRGYVSGVFRVSGILGSVVDRARANDIGVLIKDITDAVNPSYLIERLIPTHSYISDINQIVEFQDRTYQVTFSASKQYQSNNKDWISWIILICGFLIATLLQAFIMMMSGAIAHTNRIVDVKTKQLKEAITKAESANKAKSMFLANMNHELRTPLNAIIGLVNLCLKTQLTDKQAEYLYQSKLATQTLMSLINQSLDYAKIESGKLELERLEFDMAKVLQKMYAVFNTQAEQKGIKFILSVHDDIPRYLVGDSLRLEQVLLNICSNALKFTETGSVSLDVFSQSINQQSQSIIIKIKDSGIGISKAQQALLFQSFQQADNTTTRKYGGTGLGLAISKQLVELMGGRIIINSDIGEGCEFIITIPFNVNDHNVTFNSGSISSEDKMKGIEQTSNTDPQSSLVGIRILLVEDIEINRMIARELLESRGAKVSEAFDGQQALDVLNTAEGFDVVLMDIQMPVMDGFEATKALRAIPEFADLPVLAMTANAMNEDVQRCTEAGMDGHISKPIDETNMVTSILTAISQPRAQQWPRA